MFCVATFILKISLFPAWPGQWSRAQTVVASQQWDSVQDSGVLELYFHY